MEWLRYEMEGLNHWRIDEKYDSNGGGIGVDDAFRIQRYYVNGPGQLGQIVKTHVYIYPNNQTNQSSADTHYYYGYDVLGNVSVISGSNGAEADQFEQDAFGNQVEGSWSGGLGNTITERLTTKQFDADLGLYYFNAWWYDPVVGRFISIDPIGFKGGDINLYSFVSNVPIQGVDPTGTRNCWNPCTWLDEGASDWTCLDCINPCHESAGFWGYPLDEYCEITNAAVGAYCDAWIPWYDSFMNNGCYDFDEPCDAASWGRLCGEQAVFTDACIVGNYWLTGVAPGACAQSTVNGVRCVEVTTWAAKGCEPTIKAGCWVMRGGPTYRNYCMSGSFLRYPISNCLTQSVPKAALAAPCELTAFGIFNPVKWLIGQRCLTPWM